MSSPSTDIFDWYYIGHYGQLGPLSTAQIEELVRDGVVERQTYVWREGMPNWCPAGEAMELQRAFIANTISTPPPIPSGPPPGPGPQRPTIPSAPFSTPGAPPPAPTFAPNSPPMQQMMPSYNFAPAPMYAPVQFLPVSDRSRVLAGVLNIILPGVGRMYLGYVAQGVVQLLTTIFCGVGYIWALVDGILMLTGHTKIDGYGRILQS
jgi:TM2 domain-containing membrane protein YozV